MLWALWARRTLRDVGELEPEVAGGEQARDFLVDADAGPGVCGGIELLRRCQAVGFPVGELLAFGDFLAKQVGVDFLQAHVLDADLLHFVLQLDEGAPGEVGAMVQVVEIVLQRQAHLRDRLVFQQTDDGPWQSLHQVQAEQEAAVVAGHLQQGHAVGVAAPEGGPCLGVEAQDGQREQIADGPLGLLCALDDVDASGELCTGQVVEQGFVVLVVDGFH